MIYVLSFFMVSTIRFSSFKKLDIGNRKPFHVLVTVILIFIVIAYKPKIMLFFIMLFFLGSLVKMGGEKLPLMIGDLGNISGDGNTVHMDVENRHEDTDQYGRLSNGVIFIFKDLDPQTFAVSRGENRPFVCIAFTFRITKKPNRKKCQQGKQDKGGSETQGIGKDGEEAARDDKGQPL